MPGRVKVRILGARDLPVMDRASELTDAFVEIRFGEETFKTDVCKKSLNPQWNSEWFKFEVDDEVLQDEPLDLRILDYDTYSAHDPIGKVYIDLNPLLSRENSNIISGWFPIYDTMHGLRGELNVQVRVELFSDFNKFRQSSCGIQFFCSCEVPCGWRIQSILGFVEELVVNDDPEYQWIEKIRTPRASNEARQRLFSKLSGTLQRKLGVKVMEMGGNAVLGYFQNFDLEGESGVVVRGIGTAVALIRLHVGQLSPAVPLSSSVSPIKDSSFPEEFTLSSSNTLTPQSHLCELGSVDASSPACSASTSPPVSPPVHQLAQRNSTSPVRIGPGPDVNRRMSDSEIGSPPKVTNLAGNSTKIMQLNSNALPNPLYSKTSVVQQSIDLLEYPFFTMRSFPANFIVNLGGVVCARSVKLLDKIHNPEEAETRDAWWSEVRTEMRAHAAKLGCHAVLGYQEQTTICEEVIILSAMGTAAKINLNFDIRGPQSSIPFPVSPVAQVQSSIAPVDKAAPVVLEREKERHLYVDIGLANQAQIKALVENSQEEPVSKCSLCHIPYSHGNLPFDIQLTKCAICRKKNVPEVLFTTIDPPTAMPVWSKGCLIQARICRPKSKNKNSEQTARDISDSLPFLEYEVHNQLINKLKIRGLNCLFGLRIQICLGENMLAAVATATGAFVGPLPPPPEPKISTDVATAQETQDMLTLQKRITRTVQLHRERLGTDKVESQSEHSPHSANTDDLTDQEEDSGNFFLESTKDKNTFILVIDDLKDEAVDLILHDVIPPEGFEICNTQIPTGIAPERITGNLQMFTQHVLVRLQPTANNNTEFSQIFNVILRRLCFKLRHFKPCCLTDICFNVDLPDEDEVTIAVTGCCLGLQDSSQPASASASATKLLARTQSTSRPTSAVLAAPSQTDDMMFTLDGVGESAAHTQPPPVVRLGSTASQLRRSLRQLKESSRQKIPPPMGIELTPLNVIYNGRIDKYLGYYNFFFIRESTAVKESGGVGGFMQSFILEVMAIVRAHVAALGGNALLAYTMTHCILENNPQKNQGQCLINVSGDIVCVLHDGEEGVDSIIMETPVLIPAAAS
ncbi:C2 domain-containing protein 5-like isoform X4 [Biomphalaria glabrata]|uniref:C2 domain-containing protein 5-like isoform X4 n=1 Tax=Biomphalaria glabrata TaxID=6526 RepID=A0A2C9JQL9_BIOGL|nr:C2 domain-containing protein 5-like isoform X4 [Biomphalaria glabrata]